MSLYNFQIVRTKLKILIGGDFIQKIFQNNFFGKRGVFVYCENKCKQNYVLLQI